MINIMMVISYKQTVSPVSGDVPIIGSSQDIPNKTGGDSCKSQGMFIESVRLVLNDMPFNLP